MRVTPRNLRLDREGILGKAALKDLEARHLWNQLYSWPTLDAFRASGYPGWITIRDRIRDSPFFTPEVAPGTFEQVLNDLAGRGANLSTLYAQEIPTPHVVRRVMNFEVYKTERYWHLLYGTAQMNLRHDLERNGRTEEGLRAVAILRELLGPDSYDDLLELVNQFPACVVEATCFSEPVGVLYRPLVFWELRNY